MSSQSLVCSRFDVFSSRKIYFCSRRLSYIFHSYGFIREFDEWFCHRVGGEAEAFRLRWLFRL